MKIACRYLSTNEKWIINIVMKFWKGKKEMQKIIKIGFSIMMLIAIYNLQGCHRIKGLQPVELKCEDRINPLGIDAAEPRLSWILVSNERGQSQSAFQILVASSEENLKRDFGDLWDTKKVASDQTINIRYRGKKLASGQFCFWKVRVWDKNGVKSPWSEPAKWSMGLLHKSDWKAKWIGLDKAVGTDSPDSEHTRLSARYLRKEFKIHKKIKWATAYICGLGLYELYLNGTKVGDQVLSPGLTEYPKRSLYVTNDITDKIKMGDNAIGVILGNGRYFAPRKNIPTFTVNFGYPKLLLQINIEYKDGSFDTLVSDESWKITADGPITQNNVYDGETYDARKEMPGWNRSGFDDSKWVDVELVKKPSEKISAQMNEPIRVIQSIKPVALTNPKPGVYIFDMGQNMVGWTKLHVKGERGTVVKQRFSEVLRDDGSLYLDNLRSARVTDTYILKGDSVEVFEPRFVYHGFRYVELTGFPGKPNLSTIEGEVVHDDLEKAGDFVCSDSLLNAIYRNAVWGIQGNYRSIPTDCPQRDERMGWLGDRAAGSQGESYIFDISKLYEKWLTDIFDSQKDSGSIPDVCPPYWPLYRDNVSWDGTPILLANMLYLQYADLGVIAKHYNGMKKWVDYMINSYMRDYLMPRDSYGDWCVPPISRKVIHTKDPKRLTPGDYIGTGYFYHITRLMAKFAGLLNKKDDESYFNNLSEKIKDSFNRHFLNMKTIKYVNNTATANVIALAFGLVPHQYLRQIFKNLVEDIKAENYHVCTGVIGLQNINRILTKFGRADLAYKINTQRDYPSYGYMIEKGATTIWELWNGDTADPAMNSRNHVMLLGDLITWFYEDLAGIKSDENNPGFKHIIMKPTLVNGLKFVKAWHKSLYGMIKSEWKIRNNQFDWEITVPCNTYATVYVPAVSEVNVTESGKPVNEAKGVTLIEMKDGSAVFKISSGNYHFISQNFNQL